MKTFLNTCLIAMISAGIYGTYDVAGDISHNTYIQYEEDENNIASNAVQQKSLSNVIRTAWHEASTTTEKKKVAGEPELNMEYFSRSGPVYSDERLLELSALPDSTAAVNDSAKVRAVRVIAATDAPAPKPDSIVLEKRKFDVSLYSRGKPRRMRMEAAAQPDSLKK